MSAFEPFLDFITSALPYVALGSLVISLIALITTWSNVTSTRISAIRKEIIELESLLLSRQVRDARVRLVRSPPVIRAAGDNFSPWSNCKTYLEDSFVESALAAGAAKDADELTDAYAEVLMCISRAAALAPRGKKFGPVARFWRRSTQGIYSQIAELLSASDESRWELAKHPSLWPLDADSLGTKETLLSDVNLRRNIAILNYSRDNKTVQEIKVPHPNIERSVS